MPRQVTVDDHQLAVGLVLRALSGYVQPRGVVHVGAHEGEEVQAYLDAGFEQILLLEPNPRAFAVLQSRFEGNERVQALPYAVCEYDGWATLNVNVSRTGNEESSSLLGLRKLAQVVTTLHTASTVDVPARRLDTVFKDHQLRPDAFNFLSVDVQGAELRVYNGARGVLETMQAVLSEVNLIEMYDGCALEADITARLESHGFVPVESVYHELWDENGRFPAWGEVLFVRRDLVNMVRG